MKQSCHSVGAGPSKEPSKRYVSGASSPCTSGVSPKRAFRALRSVRICPALLLVSCGLAALLCGCSPAEPSKPSTPPVTTKNRADKPVTMPALAKENADGPPEKDLPAALDMPLYPGAKVVHNRIAEAGSEKHYHVTLETSDPASKVAAFYSAHGLPGVAKGDQAQILGQTKKGNLVIVDVGKKGDKTVITIKVSPDTHG